MAEAALLTGFVIAGNTLLRPLVNRINRIPIDEEAGEATYEVRLSVTAAAAADAREALIEALEAAHYPVADVETEERWSCSRSCAKQGPETKGLKHRRGIQ